MLDSVHIQHSNKGNFQLSQRLLSIQLKEQNNKLRTFCCSVKLSDKKLKSVLIKWEIFMSLTFWKPLMAYPFCVVSLLLYQ